jgi:hypothetical protein
MRGCVVRGDGVRCSRRVRLVARRFGSVFEIGVGCRVGCSAVVTGSLLARSLARYIAAL